MGISVLRDEVDKKKEELREKVMRGELPGRLAITGQKKGKMYRHVSTRPDALARRKAQGYEICTDPDVKTQFSVGDGGTPGARQVGSDLILAEIPLERYATNQAMVELSGERKLEQRMNESREKINKMYRDEARGQAHVDVAIINTSSKK